MVCEEREHLVCFMF